MWGGILAEWYSASRKESPHRICFPIRFFRRGCHRMWAGAYLGQIAPMASAEIAPLYKHMTTKLYYYYLRQEDYGYATDSRKI